MLAKSLALIHRLLLRQREGEGGRGLVVYKCFSPGQCKWTASHVCREALPHPSTVTHNDDWPGWGLPKGWVTHSLETGLQSGGSRTGAGRR